MLEEELVFAPEADVPVPVPMPVSTLLCRPGVAAVEADEVAVGGATATEPGTVHGSRRLQDICKSFGKDNLTSVCSADAGWGTPLVNFGSDTSKMAVWSSRS